MASAQNTLSIFDGKVNKENKQRIETTLYFTLRGPDGKPIRGVEEGNVSVLFEGSAANVDSQKLTAFRDGTVPIAMVFVFPITQAYGEDIWQLRKFVASTLEQSIRPIDHVGAIGYDSATPKLLRPRPPGNAAAIKSIAEQIRGWPVSEEAEPNLWNALSAALRLLDEVEDTGADGVKLKYIIVISDAEGADTAKPDKASRNIAKFREFAEQAQVTPLVLAYFPDGEDGRYFKQLRELAAPPLGSYLKAIEVSELQSKLTEFVDEMYTHYILNASLMPEQGDEWVETGKYEFGVKVEKNGEATGTIKLGVAELEKSYMWILWLILGILGGLLLIFLIIKFIRREKPEPEQEYVGGYEQPEQEASCATCGRTIPKELWGFQGEFCIEGGRPDCPYYQMPDRGKLVITRGPLTGVTFFIKEEVTTIGRQEGSHVMLQDGSVSRRHAAIRVDEGKRYELRDFDSASGTYVNGEKINRKFLRDSDKISFGTIEVEFRLK